MLVRAKRHITVKTKESETGAREESAQNYILLCVCEVGRIIFKKGEAWCSRSWKSLSGRAIVQGNGERAGREEAQLRK